MYEQTIYRSPGVDNFFYMAKRVTKCLMVATAFVIIFVATAGLSNLALAQGVAKCENVKDSVVCDADALFSVHMNCPAGASQD